MNDVSSVLVTNLGPIAGFLVAILGMFVGGYWWLRKADNKSLDQRAALDRSSAELRAASFQRFHESENSLTRASIEHSAEITATALNVVAGATGDVGGEVKAFRDTLGTHHDKLTKLYERFGIDH